jgi:hypothetical protein
VIRPNKEIELKPGSLLSELQASFAAHYPFLMIEFFQNDGRRWMLRHARMDPDTILKSIVKPNGMLSIDISDDRTVEAVLQDLSAALGLIVKMCRKSGKVWNAISLTDAWTLARQDAAGQYISSLMAGELP